MSCPASRGHYYNDKGICTYCGSSDPRHNELSLYAKIEKLEEKIRKVERALAIAKEALKKLDYLDIGAFKGWEKKIASAAREEMKKELGE